jgi:hypothetical protein
MKNEVTVKVNVVPHDEIKAAVDELTALLGKDMSHLMPTVGVPKTMEIKQGLEELLKGLEGLPPPPHLKLSSLITDLKTNMTYLPGKSQKSLSPGDVGKMLMAGGLDMSQGEVDHLLMDLVKKNLEEHGLNLKDVKHLKDIPLFQNTDLLHQKTLVALLEKENALALADKWCRMNTGDTPPSASESTVMYCMDWIVNKIGYRQCLLHWNVEFQKSMTLEEFQEWWPVGDPAPKTATIPPTK